MTSFRRHLLIRLPAFPFLRRQRLNIELVACAGISVPTHASDRIHELLVDMQVSSINRITADEDADDFAEDDFAGRADLKRGVAAAFQGGGGGEDAGAFHHLAGCRGKTRLLHLVNFGPELDGADFHLLDQRIVADVDGEFSCLANIAGGVLKAHVGIVLDADGDDGRIMGQDIEEAERASVWYPVLAHRGYQSDWTWNDGSDQNLVTFPLIELSEIKMGVVGHIRPRQRCGGFQGECGGRGSRTRLW
ncbi:exported hypothetical protein [Agrobacterium fabacearum CFBP 5771]|nr:exported hypothetical protein [Agrobacterium fabacearum CFBP 5771]